MTQACDTCMFGRGDRCHWPYWADGEDDGAWDADIWLFKSPPWLEEAIERASGRRVSDRECGSCEAYDARSEPEPVSERCAETTDMFDSGNPVKVEAQNAD